MTPASPDQNTAESAAGIPDKVFSGVRLKSLDILRGVAILLVLLYHVPDDSQMPSFQAPFGRGGWCGVDLFFVLSGFLIGSILMREQLTRGRVKKRIFWFRRAFKIFPSYFGLLVFFAFVYASYAISGRFEFSTYGERYWQYWIFVQNYVPMEYTPLAHLWSIAVEEHFYLLLPILIWLSSGKADRMARLFVGMFLFTAGQRYLSVIFGVGYRPHGWDWPLTHFRLDSLMGGVLIAYAWVFHPVRFLEAVGRYRSGIHLCLVFLFLPFLLEPQSAFMHSAGFTLLTVGNGALLVLSQTSSLQPARVAVLLGSLVAFIGRTSYNSYLWHIPLYNTGVYRSTVLAASHWAPTSVQPVLFVLLHVAFAVTVGWLATVIIEQPFLRLRSRLLPRESTSSG